MHIILITLIFWISVFKGDYNGAAYSDKRHIHYLKAFHIENQPSSKHFFF